MRFSSRSEVYEAHATNNERIQAIDGKKKIRNPRYLQKEKESNASSASAERCIYTLACSRMREVKELGHGKRVSGGGGEERVVRDDDGWCGARDAAPRGSASKHGGSARIS